jgi:hypothetical protein
MKSIKMILVVLSLSLLSLAQTNQEPKTPTSPHVIQSQILELPLNRERPPLILFERALKDKEGRCKVHHYHLEAAIVPIVYGLLPGHSKEYYEAERRKFPNAIIQYEGGCLVMSTKEAKVLQCRKCLEARWTYEKKKRGTS